VVAGVLALFVLATVLVTVLVRSASAFPGSLLPAQGAYLGSRVEARGSEGPRDAIRRVEDQIGRKFDIDHAYYSWNANIPTSHQRWDVETGRIPFVNWAAGPSWRTIASGSEDGWIRDRADAFSDFGAPIYLAFHHEPEDDLSRYGSAGDYAAAFRHIVEVFRDRGADNVAFVWTLMSWTFNPRSDRDPMAYYPGDAFVDFVGADGYNFYPGRAGDQWNSFQTIFTDVNAFAIARSKPWMVVEFGVQEDPDVPGRKGQWFRDALATAKGWPSLKAAIYFDVDKLYNWVTDTSASSMQGYSEMANDPWFRQQGAGQPPPSPTPTPPPPSEPPPPPGGAPAVVRNALNAGPDGAPIRAGRGRGPTPFDEVTITRGATLTYDDVHSRGSFSARHVLDEGSDAYYQWDGRRSVWFGRVYVWMSIHPAGDLRLVRAWSSGSGLRCSINIRSSGLIGFQDRDNRWAAIGQQPIPVGRWVRLEWKVDHRKGRVRILVFADARSHRPSEVIRVGPRLNIGSSADQFQFGRSGSNRFAVTFWTDSPALSTKGFLGPDKPRRR